METKKGTFEDEVVGFCRRVGIPESVVPVYIKLVALEARWVVYSAEKNLTIGKISGYLSSPLAEERAGLFRQINEAMKKPTDSSINILTLVRDGELTELAKLPTEMFQEEIDSVRKALEYDKRFNSRRS